MKAKKVTMHDLWQALQNTNDKHGYKLIFNREPERKGNFLHFTIRSERSGIPGARTSYSGRNLVSASWHAHGYFFEEILRIAPEAEIRTFNATITADGGNWQDFNCGSMMCPAYASELSIE
jgi:hypothetical protein